MRRVVLHVGLPKTGTSFLQDVLEQNAAPLAEQGVRLPDATGQQLFSAVLALTGRSRSWGRSPEAGMRAWHRIVRDVQGRPGTVVISSETLCLATEEQVRRIKSDLSPADIEVVLTVRDPARQLPAEWQEGVKHGRHGSYDAFLRAVLADEEGLTASRARRRHARFWAGQDPVTVLDRWAAGLAADRVHVVTVPPSGAAPDELWRRFAAVLGVPADAAAMPEGRVNASLGAAQLEVLRRVNRRFGRKGRELSYGTVVKRLYAGRILRSQGGDRPVLPPHLHEVADTLARGWMKEIADRGWHVEGELDDLVPRSAAGEPPRVTRGDVLRSSIEATAGLLEEVERLTRENAALRRRTAGPAQRVRTLGRRLGRRLARRVR